MSEIRRLIEDAYRAGYRAGLRDRSDLPSSSRWGRHSPRPVPIQGTETEIPPVGAEWYTAQGNRWAGQARGAPAARAAALMRMAAAAWKAERTMLRLEGRSRS